MSNRLAERLRELRTELGMTQKRAAEVIGFRHRPTISEIEAGRRKVTLNELHRFSRCYGAPEGVEGLLALADYDPENEFADNALASAERAVLLYVERAGKLEEIIRETLWMARRYADRRRSYVVWQVNEAVKKAEALGIAIQPDKVLRDPEGRFATDGE